MFQYLEKKGRRMNLEIIQASIFGYHLGTLFTKPSIYYVINGVWFICILFKLINKMLFGVTGFIWKVKMKLNVKRIREDNENSDESKGFVIVFIFFYIKNIKLFN